MGLAEVLVAVGVAAVVSHVDGRHFGDVEGAVVPEVLECSREDSGGDGGMVVSCEDERGQQNTGGRVQREAAHNSRGRRREPRGSVSDARRKRGP